MNILLLAALLVFALTLFLLLENMFACWNIPLLDTVAPINAAELPFVSVIIPALNEEQHIEQALSSVLALTYPRLEIIALDDRSTDATPASLERIAAQHPKLRVVRIQELPPGWRGYGARDYIDHPDTARRQAELAALDERMAGATRQQRQAAAMPFLDELPPDLRGPNERIDEPLPAAGVSASP